MRSHWATYISCCRMGFVVMSVKWWWKEVGLVPNPLLGQSRPFVQGGAGECPVYCRGSAQWVNRARCSRVGRSNVLSWFWHMLSMGPMGERVKGLPAGRWEADILCRSSAITQGLVQLDLQQKTDHLMGPGQKPSPETAGVGME